jgi:hypothetical protein
VVGFRYALVLEDGEPADPAFFNTALDEWRAGDEFLAGAELARFRIAGIDPVLADDDGANSVRRGRPSSR